MELFQKDLEKEYDELHKLIKLEHSQNFELLFMMRMFAMLVEQNQKIREDQKKSFRSLEKDLDITRCKIVRRINSLKEWDKNYSNRMPLYNNHYLDDLRKKIQDYRCYSI